MSHARSVFSQLIAYLPQCQLDTIIEHYQGNWHVRRFPVWSQLLCMTYAQLTHGDSLRDVEACLNSQGKRLYHMGIQHRVARSTLADANEVRDFRIFQELGQLLITQALELYHDEPLGLELKETLYTLDSTTIDLCLTLFPWADFRRTKVAIKVHTLLSLRGPIPAFIEFSDGRSHDVNALDAVPIPKRSLVAMDRGYTDWERLYAIHGLPAYFVIRAEDNLAFRRVASTPVKKSKGLRADQTITITTWRDVMAASIFVSSMLNVSERTSENWHPTAKNEGVGGGNEGIRGHDDLIPGWISARIAAISSATVQEWVSNAFCVPVRASSQAWHFFENTPSPER